MKIRLATVEDASILGRLNQDVQRLHANAAPHFFKQPDNVTHVVHDFEENLLTDPHGRIFIAENDGEPAGYICAFIVQRTETPYTFAQQFAHIGQLSVKPAFRKRGCGRALVQVVFDLARSENIVRVTLDTWAFNTEAQQFFARVGFKPVVYRMETLLSREHMEHI
jgi:diamine N-acetyltransferase